MITECTEAQALEILHDRSVLPLLSVYPVGVKDVEMYKVGPALLLALPHGKEIEVHIACRFRERAGLKQHLTDALDWLKSRGFDSVFTTAPDHRGALVNMLKSLNFRKDGGRWVWE